MFHARAGGSLAVGKEELFEDTESGCCGVKDRCSRPYSRSLAGVGGRLEGASESVTIETGRDMLQAELYCCTT